MRWCQSPTSTDEFQSTLPMRGATNRLTLGDMETVFQSTLPMRGATVPPAISITLLFISIHAPHEGSDSKMHQNTDANFR